MEREKIIEQVERLMKYYYDGLLGGQIMPEDENPGLERSSREIYHYFTLPMALNYQRNSYKLWESANKTYQDEKTRFVFDPEKVVKSSFEDVQIALVKYKVALQKNKQTEIWINLCKTIVEDFDGDIRTLFHRYHHNVVEIRTLLQKTKKKSFPYLSGTKICNYWMYVIMQYTNEMYQDVQNLTVAPDTHVIQSSLKLGLINEEEAISSKAQKIVIEKWNQVLKGSNYHPIDIHTPLWLWSRNGFVELK